MIISSWIDAHCHLRWDEYKDHNYLQLGILQAAQKGARALIEMPNTDPPLTILSNLNTRYSEVESLKTLSILLATLDVYRYMGITKKQPQVTHALKVIQEGLFNAIGDKTYYADSTGNMGINDLDYYKWVWNYKGSMGYTGVSAGHFEEPALFTGEFDPKHPITHNWRQNPTAETVSVDRQLHNAEAAKFKGTFYICHVSNPATIELVKDWRRTKQKGFKIVLEMTWHHALLNIDSYPNINPNNWKCNPPIRDRNLQQQLLTHLLKGDIDIICTDHAPHPVERKQSDTPPSGLPGIPFWPKGIEILRKLGMEEPQIQDLTFNNANRVFDLGLKPYTVNVEYDPSMWDEYGYNPYSHL